MRWELRPVLRALGNVQLVRAARPRTWLASLKSGRVLIFQTGMGPDAASEALTSILSSYTPGAIINTGCAGALVSDLAVGAVVCASTLQLDGEVNGPGYQSSPPLTSALARAANAAGCEVFSG